VKDTPKVVEHLKSANKRTMDFAREIRKGAVVAAIRQAMGLKTSIIQSYFTYDAMVSNISRSFGKGQGVGSMEKG
jgi:hypothetical protein